VIQRKLTLFFAMINFFKMGRSATSRMVVAIKTTKSCDIYGVHKIKWYSTIDLVTKCLLTSNVVIVIITIKFGNFFQPSHRIYLPHNQAI
jgi:hypothetical protein